VVLTELNDIQEQVTPIRELTEPSKLELPDRDYCMASPESMKRGFTF